MKTQRMHRFAVIFVCLVFVGVNPAYSQDPLSLSNSLTRIRSISFRLRDTDSFTDERLLREMATKAPVALDKWKDRLDFLPYIRSRSFPFDPIELQRDVIRLRRFYERNGFPEADIDYPASQYRLSDNSIHIILTISEGQPLTIDSLGVVLVSPIREGLAPRWNRLVSSVTASTGLRFTEIERLRIENQFLSLLQNGGHAFATISSEVTSSQNSKISLVVSVNPGPVAIIDEIQFEGITRVGRNTVLRELPFRIGDRYSRKKMIQGQRELFSLGLFRLALADLPDQPKDSTVAIRYRVRESSPRFVSAETGFSREAGLSFESSLRHRNMLGGGRQLSASFSANSAWLSLPATGRQAVRSVSASFSFRQPWLGTTRLSGSVAPFYSWKDDPNLGNRLYETGLSTGLLYEFFPFRTLSAQHTFSRAVPLLDGNLGERFDIYNKNILSVSATLGRVNNFLNPRRGFLVRPHVEAGGLLGASGVDFLKATISFSAYLPVSRNISAAFSLSAGRLNPRGNSKNQVSAENEFRFDAIRFYSGGSSDVRGWGLNALGPQVAVADTLILNPDGSWSARNAHFEAIGGESKLTTRLEVRHTLPGPGTAWSVALFLDGGLLSSTLRTDSDGKPLFTPEGIPDFLDSGTLDLRNMQFGVGAGIRYRTPVGLMRFDLAYKLNPTDADLQSATDTFLYRSGVLSGRPDQRWIRRLNVHLSIERTF